MPQKKPEKKLPGWGYAAAGGIPAAAAFALARKARPGILNKALTNVARTKGVFREIDTLDAKALNNSPMRDLLAYLVYGTKHVGDGGREGRAAKGLLHFNAADKPKGPLGLGPTKADVRRFGYDDKLKELMELQKIAPGLVPKTTPLAKVFSGPIPKGNALKPWLQSRFKKLGNKWILKGRDDRQSMGTLLSDQDDLDTILAHMNHSAGKRIPDMGITLKRFNQLHKSMMRSGGGDEWINYSRMNPEFTKAWRLKNYLRAPSSGMAQKRVPLAEHPIFGTPEFRVHMVEGKVVPGTQSRMSVARGALGHLGWDPQAKKVEDMLRKALEPGLARSGSKLTGGFDVAMGANGKPVIFEANANSYSGLLHGEPSWHPADLFQTMLPNHKLQSALQGQDTHLLAGLKGLGAGATGLGSYGAARQLAGDKDAKNRWAKWLTR